ncbi:ZirU family protein [Edwardsiella piscicida]|uniref:ZirU family protein n=3 Tax=Edwardsiella TaxID=635 RepID=A0AAQ3BZI2_EDWPI|nr:ZirU family protein [Edwardsiella piscicida]ACY85867.1 putative invasin [Edwardsiella tarda EIB202]ADM42865.1 putative invasin [Edwardsiella tarda FL6-60]ARD18750.1 invasin [Edwardsiella piscicida]ELM3737712.1 inverse autotransporter beta domain-containing protein [Edwardsiella piscicida]QBB12792.1 invasin [Edwardsiella piscicida]
MKKDSPKNIIYILSSLPTRKRGLRKPCTSCAEQSERLPHQGYAIVRCERVIGWLTIALQIAFPLGLSFTPAIAQAPKVDERALLASATQPYVLKEGESVTTVAQKLGISVAQLKQVNAYRIFARGFEHVGVGDEIDIPVDMSSLNTQAGQAPKLSSAMREPSRAEKEAQAVGQLMSVGATLSSTRPSEAAAGMARSMATNAANEEIQQWLSKYGTARVQLNLDKNFSLSESALDWFIPVWDSANLTAFTQLGARNKDRRNTINLGVGARTLLDRWMLGVNMFYDHDLTGHNSRLGIGAEAWTDYLQLSTNGYMRLSNWHQSRDFADYDERAANGFDIRANAWLPALPQLGGKLVYEQYIGENVALFGKENLQRNPYALTAGVNYTPFPLLTVGVDERLGKAGRNDTQFSIQLSYRPGLSWQSQIDPSSVAAIRQIAESRYNLVDRNNDIVLEYKKQEVIKLALSHHAINDLAGAVYTVSANLKSKYALDQVSWQDGGLVAAGGQLTVIDKNHFSLMLPPYRPAQAKSDAHQTSTAEIAANTYQLIAVAFDNQGNQSNSETLRVVVQPPQVTAQGTFVISGDGARANGSDKIGVDFIIKDTNGNPLANREVVFHTNNGAQPGTITVTTDDNGIAHFDVTNTSAGTTHVSATFDDQTQGVDITFANAVNSVIVTGLVNGYPLVGTPLHAEVTCATGECPASLTYQWQIEDAINSGNYVDIPAATAVDYIPVGTDQKRRIQVVIGGEGTPAIP